MEDVSLDALHTRLEGLLEAALGIAARIEAAHGWQAVDSKPVPEQPPPPELAGLRPEDAREAASRWLDEAQRYIEAGGLQQDHGIPRRATSLTRDLQHLLNRIRRFRVDEDRGQAFSSTPHE